MRRIVEHSPNPYMLKLHMALTLPDSSIQLMFGNQVQNGANGAAQITLSKEPPFNVF